MEFMFTISEVPEIEPEYQVIPEKNLPKVLDDALKIIESKPNEYLEALNNLTQVPNSTNPQPTILGTNFAGTLCNFFIHGDDTLEIADEKDNGTRGSDQPKHHHKLVKLELAQDENGQVIEKKIKRDPDEIVDPSKPRKYYKRVIKKVPLQ